MWYNVKNLEGRIHETAENGGIPQASSPDEKIEYTPEDEKKDITIVYIQTGVKIVKLYAPAVIVGTLSITGILASNNILRKRNVALAAAYAAIDKNLKEYRKRVIERFGERVDKELRHNIKAVTVAKTDSGKQETVDTVPESSEPCSAYARFFDEESSRNWKENHEYNMMFLRAQQQEANDRLKAYGYIFLNDVYELLGLAPSKAGQVVGWIYNPENPVGDNYVDFGIQELYETPENSPEDFERTILLDFNVDGYILDYIPEKSK